MLEKNLETCLNNSFKYAHSKKHEFVTTEHLLLSILDNDESIKVLTSCNVNIETLRAELTKFVEDNTPLTKDEAKEIQPTLSYQRVIQRAVFHVQSTGAGEVTGANVLVALFSEKESQSVYLLKKQGMNRLDAVAFLSHGEKKLEDENFSEFTEEKEVESKTDSNISKFALNLNEEAIQGRALNLS